MLTNEILERKFGFLGDLNTTEFIYDQEDILAEVDEANQVVAGYLHGPGIDNVIAMVRDVNGNRKFEDSEIFYYTKDHLGSVKELTDKDGKVVQRYRYSAYGETKIEKASPQTQHKLIENRYAFTGRELEDETGFYDYRARNLNPAMRIFLSPDPIGIKGGDGNLYRYVSNNSLRFVDPLGLTQQDIDLAFKYVLAKYPEAAKLSYRVAEPGELADNLAGRFTGKEIILSPDYLKNLCGKKAADLLDTAFHEVGHSQNVWKMYGDALLTPGHGKNNYFHRQIYDQAILDTADSISDYLKERKR